MAILHESRRLKKELSLFSVYAIATGTTLSAGFFLLPTYAAERAGPAIILAYVVSAALLVPPMLCIVELATAMPRAGGAYYFLDRSLGPLAGTVGGLGTWLALVLKAAFALVGMGAYLALLFGMVANEYPSLAWLLGRFNFRSIAAVLAILFGIVNLLGAQKTGRFQVILVFGLLAILAWFITHGSTQVDPVHFEGFFDEGWESIVATAGLVFISYVGVTNVASVSEEVKDPERNLPLGIFLALTTAVLVYVLGIGVMVGVLGAPGLVGLDPPAPVAEAASFFSSTWGIALVSFAALLAFSSVANAGILSASRYPLAMGRDHLLPPIFCALSRRGTPKVAIFITVATVLGFLLLPDPASIAKLASGFQFLIFGLICVAVIIMRQSGLESYDPGYKAPFYPWLQIVGILAPIWIIAEMGWLPILFTSGMVAVGILWYRGYARKRVDRHGAVYHVFEKLGRRRYSRRSWPGPSSSWASPATRSSASPSGRRPCWPSDCPARRRRSRRASSRARGSAPRPSAGAWPSRTCVWPASTRRNWCSSAARRVFPCPWVTSWAVRRPLSSTPTRSSSWSARTRTPASISACWPSSPGASTRMISSRCGWRPVTSTASRRSCFAATGTCRCP
jgi:amino acid transporter